jgi:hypothetical protein
MAGRPDLVINPEILTSQNEVEKLVNQLQQSRLDASTAASIGLARAQMDPKEAQEAARKALQRDMKAKAAKAKAAKAQASSGPEPPLATPLASRSTCQPMRRSMKQLLSSRSTRFTTGSST